MYLQNTYEGIPLYNGGAYLLGDSNIYMMSDCIQFDLDENGVIAFDWPGIGNFDEVLETKTEILIFEGAINAVKNSDKINDPRFFKNDSYPDIVSIRMIYMPFPPDNASKKTKNSETGGVRFTEFKLVPCWYFTATSDVLTSGNYSFLVNAITGEPYLCSQ